MARPTTLSTHELHAGDVYIEISAAQPKRADEYRVNKCNPARAYARQIADCTTEAPRPDARLMLRTSMLRIRPSSFLREAGKRGACRKQGCASLS